MDRKIHPAQQRRFFALANTLGYEAEEAKNRAKKFFKKEHFADLTVEEAATLIDKLELQVETKMIKCPNCRGTGYMPKEKLETEGE